MAHIAIDARIVNSSTGRYVERLLTHLETLDTTNTYSVLVPTKDSVFWKPTNPNFTVRTVDFDNYSINEQIGFKRYLDTLSADLVHFCMPQQPVLYKGRVVTTFHDLTLLLTYNSDKNWLIFHAKQLVGRWVFKKVAKKSDAIIAISDYTKKDVHKRLGVPKRKIHTTYEAAELVSSKKSPYKSPFKRYLLYVGQQSDYKNIRRLGDAHQKLLEKYPDLGLILVGNKNESARSNEQYFTTQKYKNIHFTGFVSDAELNWLYANATLYTFPSIMEGFGLPGLEAMLHDLPVVSSNQTCLPEVYGDAAYYFDPFNVDDIARAVDTVLSDTSLQKRLVTQARLQVKKYSWRVMAEQTLDVYKKVLKD